MNGKHIRKKVDRLSAILLKDEPSEAEQKEAVSIGLDLVASIATNLSRIADAVEKDNSV